MKETDILDLPATRKNLLQLARNGLLDLRAFERSLKIIGDTPNASNWNRFLNILLLVLGAGLSVSGIFFFFAYNWAGMHRFVKLGIVEVLILLMVFAVSQLSLDKLPGKITLTVAGLFIGVLLAVFGQVYQTGADSYRLFLAWTILMAGWVFISKFIPMWFIWALLINTTLFLYLNQIVGLDDSVYLWMFCTNGIFVLAWEFGLDRQLDWLTSRWPLRLLSLIVFYAITAPPVIIIFDGERTPELFIMSALFVVVNSAVIYIYSWEIPDMFMLTLSMASLMVVMNTWLVDNIHVGDFTSLLIGVFIIAHTALGLTFLLWVSKSRNARNK
jgi:uncharacterized membrane protein